MKWIAAVITVLAGLTVFGLALSPAQQARPSPTPAQSADSTRKPSCPVPSVPPIPPIPPVPPVGLGKVMYPVNLVMQNARALNLTAEQKTFMQGEIQTTTKRFNELQWELNDAMEVLVEAVKADATTEQEALTLLDKALNLEREIKRLHMTMGLRIKNNLTPEQRRQLDVLRKSR
jgi:Spy/CpxP family protein refolding chaperone